MSQKIFSIVSENESETGTLARQFSKILAAGDVVILEGEIGAGKSAFCRALIKAYLGEDAEVPSPTFTIVQTYDAPDFEIWHCDLYRLSNPDEVIELGIDEAMETALVLIEWPDRLGDMVPEEALKIAIAAEDDNRQFNVHGSTGWALRLSEINDAT